MLRGSRAPLVAGLIATGLAVAGLLILLGGTYVGVRDAHVVRHLFPTLTADATVSMVPAGLLALALLVAAGLVVARRDAARSALVWLCGTGPMVVALLLGAHVRLLRNWEYNIWIGPPGWVGGLGALLAAAAMATAAICLGVPAGRRAIAPAEPAATQDEPGPGAPAPLRAAAARFVLGGAVGVAAYLAAAFLDGRTTGSAEALMAIPMVAGLLVAGAAVASLSAAHARSGRRFAANLARAGATVTLLAQLWSLFQATGTIVAGRYPDTRHVPPALGVALLGLAAAGIVATLAGLAGLADPRSERHLHEPAPFPRTEWETWTSMPPEVQPQEQQPERPRVNGWSAP